jgi:hypothetical protein
MAADQEVAAEDVEAEAPAEADVISIEDELVAPAEMDEEE